MAKNGFVDHDRGWDKLMTSFEVNAGEDAVFVGMLRSSGVHKGKDDKRSGDKAQLTMAQVAAVHEFGSADGRIPQRSFIAASVDANKRLIEGLIKKLSNQIIDGETSKNRALHVVGAMVQSLMRKRITQGIPPSNAPSTVARKHSSTPLVDTGQLIGAIDFEVKSGVKK